MYNQEKRAETNIVVRTSYPVTTSGIFYLYVKTYSFLSLRDALSLVECEIKAGYRVDIYFPGDEELYYDIYSKVWQI